MLFPACDATIVHVPAATNVAVLAFTVQTLVVLDEKLTANPELALALKVNGVPTFCAAIELKVMFCAALFTAKLCETAGAAAYVLLPGCMATIVQVPEVRKLAVVPETVQTLAVEEL